MAAPLVQSKTGLDVTDQTSITVTFDSAPTENNLLICAVATKLNPSTFTVPSGFTLLSEFSAFNTGLLFAFKVAGAGEPSALTPSWVAARPSACVLLEYSGLLSSSPKDVNADAVYTAPNTSQSSGTTGVTAPADELAVAIYAIKAAQHYDLVESLTNGYTELVRSGSVGSPGLIIATKDLSATGTQETTISTTDAGTDIHGAIATFKEIVAGGPITSRHYPRGVMRGEMRGVA